MAGNLLHSADRRGIALLQFLTIFLLAATASALPIHLNQPSYSASEANAIIANASYYVNLVNQTAYVLYTPNLTASYHYLSKAYAFYNASPDIAAAYAYKAERMAEVQYGVLKSYQESSVPVLLVAGFVSLVLLVRFMRVERKPTRRRTNKS
jgi:hypothetical protein